MEWIGTRLDYYSIPGRSVIFSISNTPYTDYIHTLPDGLYVPSVSEGKLKPRKQDATWVSAHAGA